MKIAVILPAAGVGRRFGAANKLEVDLAGKPVFLRAVELFRNRPRGGAEVGQIILAVHPEQLDDFKFRWGDKLGFLGVTLIAGGMKERWETVAKALEVVESDCTHIAVHDAARPLATDKLISRLFEEAAHCDAVIPALPVRNTLKRVKEEDESYRGNDPLDAILGSDAPDVRRVVETIDRGGLFEVQTPQVFEVKLLRRAYAAIQQGGEVRVTDDAALVEALGQPVRVVEGEATNIKITLPADLELALALAEKREAATASELAKKRLFADEED